jgi:hypothetical protein
MAYTIEQVREAIQNARAAGDTAAAEKLSMISYRMAAEQAPVEQYDPTADMGTGQRVLAGIGQGMTNVGRHAANLVGLQSDEQLADAKALDAPLLATGAGKTGALIGEVAATAPLMVGGAGVVGRVGMGAKVLSNPIARGVVEGAAQGALMADPGEKGAGAIMGGAFGGALPAAGAGLGKLAHGIKRTPEAERLLAQGVDLTPGQMNPGGIWNQMEESWQSVPLVGPVIKGARDNAQNSFQRAATQAAAAPGARIAQGPADEMLDAAYKSFAPLYDQARGFPLYPGTLRTQGGDVALATFGGKPGALRRAALDRGVRADDATRKSVGQWLENQLTQLPGKGRGQVSSDDLLDLRSAIRTEARKAATKGDDAAADLLKNGERAITESLESQLPADALQALRTADSRYGIYKTLEDAVARSKDMPGGFTPSKLSEAVAGANRGLGKGSYARGGGGPLRDLSEAGTATMNVRSPPTGQRLAAIGLPLAASGAAPGVAVPAGAALLGMVGTQTGRRAAAGQLPAQKLAQALEEAAKRGVAEPYRNVAAQYLRRASVAGLLGN